MRRANIPPHSSSKAGVASSKSGVISSGVGIPVSRAGVTSAGAGVMSSRASVTLSGGRHFRTCVCGVLVDLHAGPHSTVTEVTTFCVV